MKNKFKETKWVNHKYDPIKKIRVVTSGFWFVLKSDFSVAYKVVISIVLLFSTIIYRDLVDVMLILLATGYMLSMEILNSCIELLCDFHETGYNEKIKVIKDVSSVAAGISIFVWLLIIIYEFYKMFFAF
jgi:diacylglycerol kinase